MHSPTKEFEVQSFTYMDEHIKRVTLSYLDTPVNLSCPARPNGQKGKTDRAPTWA